MYASAHLLPIFFFLHMFCGPTRVAAWIPRLRRSHSSSARRSHSSNSLTKIHIILRKTKTLSAKEAKTSKPATRAQSQVPDRCNTPGNSMRFHEEYVISVFSDGGSSCCSSANACTALWEYFIHTARSSPRAAFLFWLACAISPLSEKVLLSFLFCDPPESAKRPPAVPFSPLYCRSQLHARSRAWVTILRHLCSDTHHRTAVLSEKRSPSYRRDRCGVYEEPLCSTCFSPQSQLLVASIPPLACGVADQIKV